MARLVDEDDASEVTLFELKDDLGNMSAKCMRKVVALLINLVDERSTEKSSLTKKLSIF